MFTMTYLILNIACKILQDHPENLLDILNSGVTPLFLFVSRAKGRVPTCKSV